MYEKKYLEEEENRELMEYVDLWVVVFAGPRVSLVLSGLLQSKNINKYDIKDVRNVSITSNAMK